VTDALDPELRALARLIPRLDLSDGSVRLVRAAQRWLPSPRSSRDVLVEERVLDGVRAWVFSPRASLDAPLPGLLWLHGGGYVIGSPSQDGARCRALAAALGVVVVAPAYRLAPEHPFPAARDDAHRALRAMVEDRSLRVRADRIAIAGVSAGGGLAAALALHLRKGGPALAAQILLYPMLDDRTTARHDIDEARLRVWSQASNVYGWRSYLGVPPAGPEGAVDHSAPDGAVPARASSLAGLPSTWIGVGTADLFHDECVAFAERLRASGVPCTLQLARGAYHGFDVVSPRAAVSRRFEASWIGALRAAIA
jgi:acetyl esterase/lipase